jgi:hypothetical protein
MCKCRLSVMHLQAELAIGLFFPLQEGTMSIVS